ncbi:MAG TPA: LysM peptidoglycan-binding domain-containing protein [Devosiaceae bacterium]|jgi:nucleoid-associated protein YgaU|nr:LysM peptidoglycan-binding domain-containing protein [Devosiaceae bacterium]
MAVLAGPTLVDCYGSPAGLGSCLRDRVATVGLLPAREAPVEIAAPDAAPVVPDADEPGVETAAAPPAAASLPQLNLLRAEPDGSLVIAGSGPPGAPIEVYADGELLGSATAEATGDWVVVPERPLQPGGAEITVGVAGKPQASGQAFLVVIDEDRQDEPLIVETEPGEASQVLQGLLPPATAEPEPQAEPAALEEPHEEAATAEPGPGPEASPAAAPEQQVAAAQPDLRLAPPAAAARPDRVESFVTPRLPLLPPPEEAPRPQPDSELEEAPPPETALEVARLSPPQLSVATSADTSVPAMVQPSIDAIEIDGTANFFAGAGAEGSTVRLYVDDRFVADTEVEEGRWLVEAEGVLTERRQRVRVDVLEPGSARVLARAEANLVVDRAPDAAIAPQVAAAPEAETAGPRASGSGEAPAAAEPEPQPSSRTEEQAPFEAPPLREAPAPAPDDVDDGAPPPQVREEAPSASPETDAAMPAAAEPPPVPEEADAPTRPPPMAVAEAETEAGDPGLRTERAGEEPAPAPAAEPVPDPAPVTSAPLPEPSDRVLDDDPAGPEAPALAAPEPEPAPEADVPVAQLPTRSEPLAGLAPRIPPAPQPADAAPISEAETEPVPVPDPAPVTSEPLPEPAEDDPVEPEAPTRAAPEPAPTTETDALPEPSPSEAPAEPALPAEPVPQTADAETPPGSGPETAPRSAPPPQADGPPPAAAPEPDARSTPSTAAVVPGSSPDGPATVPATTPAEQGVPAASAVEQETAVAMAEPEPRAEPAPSAEAPEGDPRPAGSNPGGERAEEPSAAGPGEPAPTATATTTAPDAAPSAVPAPTAPAEAKAEESRRDDAPALAAAPAQPQLPPPVGLPPLQVPEPAAPGAAPDAEAPATKAAPQDEDIPTIVARRISKDRFASGTAIIRRGDNLWTIARRVYGDGLKYTTIYRANKDQIRNPARIYPGQVFDLPLVYDD